MINCRILCVRKATNSHVCSLRRNNTYVLLPVTVTPPELILSPSLFSVLKPCFWNFPSVHKNNEDQSFYLNLLLEWDGQGWRKNVFLSQSKKQIFLHIDSIGLGEKRYPLKPSLTEPFWCTALVMHTDLCPLTQSTYNIRSHFINMHKFSLWASKWYWLYCKT